MVDYNTPVSNHKDGEMMSSPVVDRIKNLIEQNLESNMSLPEISKRVGISVFYMSHIFKNTTGMTVVEYRTLLRINKAKKELRETDKNITSIAYDCGFSSQGYFSERFLKVCGMSPTRYRSEKKIQENVIIQ